MDCRVGCTGFSFVPRELYERVTSVTCAGLVLSKICVSESFCEVPQPLPMLLMACCDLKKFQFSALCDLQVNCVRCTEI